MRIHIESKDSSPGHNRVGFNESGSEQCHKPIRVGRSVSSPLWCRGYSLTLASTYYRACLFSAFSLHPHRSSRSLNNFRESVILGHEVLIGILNSRSREKVVEFKWNTTS
jgi:hypothetical protein